MLFNTVNVSISSPVPGYCHCTYLKGSFFKEKEKELEREKTKIVLKEIEKSSGKILHPIKFSVLLEKVYPPHV